VRPQSRGRTTSSATPGRGPYVSRDLETRKGMIYEFQRYEAEQQYYVYTTSVMVTGTWQPDANFANSNHLCSLSQIVL
jgi:hypothetical protein